MSAETPVLVETPLPAEMDEKSHLESIFPGETPERITKALEVGCGLSGAIDYLLDHDSKCIMNYESKTRNTCHAKTPRLGVQKTIFSGHEVFRYCCHFHPFDILQKNMKIMKKLSVLITKYTTFTIILVSSTLTYFTSR